MTEQQNKAPIPVAYAIFAENGNIRLWSASHADGLNRRIDGEPMEPLYTAPPAESEELARLRAENAHIKSVLHYAATAPHSGWTIAQGVARAASKPKANALVWRTFCVTSGNCAAETPFGEYVAQNEYSDEPDATELGWALYVPGGGNTSAGFYATCAEAKAAAQADYDRRILSAIEGGEDA